MSNTLEMETSAPAVAQSGQTERRRPGRLENPSPHLIPLMRKGGLPPLSEAADATFDDLADDFAYEDEDQMAPMRGLATALLLSGGIWCMIGYGVLRLVQ